MQTALNIFFSTNYTSYIFMHVNYTYLLKKYFIKIFNLACFIKTTKMFTL